MTEYYTTRNSTPRALEAACRDVARAKDPDDLIYRVLGNPGPGCFVVVAFWSVVETGLCYTNHARTDEQQYIYAKYARRNPVEDAEEPDAPDYTCVNRDYFSIACGDS